MAVYSLADKCNYTLIIYARAREHSVVFNSKAAEIKEIYPLEVIFRSELN